MLSRLKSKIKEAEEKNTLEKQEKKEKWNKEQEELKNMLDSYYLKYKGFLDSLQHLDFVALYKIYNKNEMYNDYIKIYYMLREIRMYKKNIKDEGVIDNSYYFKGQYTRMCERVKENYSDIELMRRFLDNPSRFKELIAPYDLLDRDIYRTVRFEFEKKLDKILWNEYDTVQVKKLKFFYDLFADEGKPIKVEINSYQGEISGGGIEYRGKESIYEFVFSNIRYCELLDQINN